MTKTRKASSTVPRTAARSTRHVAVRRTGDTRERILAAAKVRFSRDSYESVGVREIASDAGVDAALVNRYFGSKARLFEEVLEDAFCVEDHVPSELGTLGEHVARQIIASATGCKWCDRGDPLQLLLRSAASPKASALLSRAFHAEFVKPLARRLKGPNAYLRASMVCAYIIGYKSMFGALKSPGLRRANGADIVTILGRAIQACV